MRMLLDAAAVAGHTSVARVDFVARKASNEPS